MTKYILVGGYPRKAPDGGKALAEEMVRDFEDPVKFLICYFARPRIQWEVNMVEDRLFFGGHLSGKKIEYQMAQVDTFVEQLHWANVVYIRGGTSATLLERLSECPGWGKELAGKTIAGSSAGAMALAKYDYNLDTLEFDEGLGLVPVKILVHYRSNYNAPNVDWDKAEVELKNYKEDLPLVALREGEFKVFEK